METKSENTLWKWDGKSFNKKSNKENQFSVTEFLEQSKQKAEETVLGPGGGAGIGCGVGLGFGLVGGLGYNGMSLNHFKLFFGVGLGCGVGLGIGFGRGIGYGFSLDSFKSHSDSKRRALFEI